MNSSLLLGISTFIYLLATVLYMAVFVFRASRIGLPATLVTLAGILVQTAGIGLRWIESYQMGIGHAPLSNMYESLVFFSWTIAVIYLIIEFIYKNRMIGAFAMPFAFFSMAYASFAPEISQRISPLVPWWPASSAMPPLPWPVAWVSCICSRIVGKRGPAA